MFYTIYKITNKINNKIYIGCHKTKKIDDNYMGSGKYLKSAQEKYGIENFEKEILEIFDNPETMFEMEAKLVNSEFVERDDTYNLKEGGYGGFDFLNRDYEKMVERNKKAGNAANLMVLNDPEMVKKRKETASIVGRNHLKKFHQKRKEDEHIDKKFREHCSNIFKGKNHTDESKQKISIAKKGKYSGKGNPSYGTIWIHNLDLKESKKIKKEDFSEWVSVGWLKGRKIKFDLEEIKIVKQSVKINQRLENELILKDETLQLFDAYLKSNYISLNEFSKNELTFSLVTFTKRLKKFVPEYEKYSKQGFKNLKEIFKQKLG